MCDKKSIREPPKEKRKKITKDNCDGAPEPKEKKQPKEADVDYVW